MTRKEEKEECEGERKKTELFDFCTDIPNELRDVIKKYAPIMITDVAEYDNCELIDCIAVAFIENNIDIETARDMLNMRRTFEELIFDIKSYKEN